MARSYPNPPDRNSWGPTPWDPIPGETPIDDISGLIPKGIETRAALNALEAENIRKAVMKYLAAKPARRLAPFTLDWCYKLHRQMFGHVWTWAGTRRQTELNIGVPAYRVDTDLQTLLDDVHFWRKHPGMDAVEQAARLHHRAVWIHPFLNGNGRWARMLANIHLKLAGAALTMWPEETVGNESIVRGEYLAAVRAAEAGDYAALIELHRRFSR
jgi:Fic-DOC domain mobile mystery protein B